jgi:hypothetical protein
MMPRNDVFFVIDENSKKIVSDIFTDQDKAVQEYLSEKNKGNSNLRFCTSIH